MAKKTTTSPTSVAQPKSTPVVYLKNRSTISTKEEAERLPLWLQALLASLTAQGIEYVRHPRGGGFVCKGALVHLSAEICMFCVVLPGGSVGRGACVGGETEVRGRVHGNAETDGRIVVTPGGLIGGGAIVTGLVTIGDTATVAGQSVIHAKAGINFVDGVIRGTALVTDFTSGRPPAAYEIRGAHGDHEIDNKVKVYSQESLQAYFDGISDRLGAI